MICAVVTEVIKCFKKRKKRKQSLAVATYVWRLVGTMYTKQYIKYEYFNIEVDFVINRHKIMQHLQEKGSF